MGRYGRAGACIDLDALTPNTQRPEAGELRSVSRTPALHRRLVDEEAPRAPSAFLPHLVRHDELDEREEARLARIDEQLAGEHQGDEPERREQPPEEPQQEPAPAPGPALEQPRPAEPRPAPRHPRPAHVRRPRPRVVSRDWLDDVRPALTRAIADIVSTRLDAVLGTRS